MMPILVVTVAQFIERVGQYAFLKNALHTSIVVGLITGIIGCFIVLQRMSNLGDAISHSVLPGVAISYMVGQPYFIGAVICGLLTTLGITMISQNSRIKYDAAISIVFSAFLALGLILVSRAQTAIDLQGILFGNVLTIRPADQKVTYWVTAIVLVLIVLFYKEIKATIFDKSMAQAYGLKVKWINYLLMTLLTLVTVAALQTVGVIMVVALLIVPASTAYLLTNRLLVMIGLSSVISVISCIIGLYYSYGYNLPSGPTMVLVACFFFILAFLFSPSQGYITRKLFKHNRKDEVHV